MEKHLKLLDRTCRLCKNTIVLKGGYVTPKTCYDYADILRNFFGVLTTVEDRTISCIMLNIFLFYLLFTYTFGFSFTIRLCGRLISAPLQLNQSMIYAISLHMQGYCSHFQDESSFFSNSWLYFYFYKNCSFAQRDGEAESFQATLTHDSQHLVQLTPVCLTLGSNS